MLGTVADVLTEAGHNVTMLVSIIDEAERGKYGVKKTKQLIFVEPDESATTFMKNMKKFQEDVWNENMMNPMTMIDMAGKFGELFSGQCNKVLGSTELLDQIRAEKYDLAVAEPFDMCAYALFEAVNIRAHVAVISSCRFDPASDVLGQPLATSYVPGAHSPFDDKMTMKQRFTNTLGTLAGSYVFSYVADYQYSKARDFVNINRSWREVLPEASFIFTNEIPILDFAAPKFDKIVPIGGITVNTKRENMKVPEKWDTILSLRKQNVLISFGSIAKSVQMPDDIKWVSPGSILSIIGSRKSLLEVFASMPDVTFIWKYEDETDNIANHLDNVYLGSWLPQNELLSDPRLKLFVTHGGLASTLELAHFGKPAVMIPLFAEQNKNAAMLQRHGGAELLNKNDLKNPKLIRQTIENVLYTPSYRQNAEELAEKLNNLPTNSRETLIKHVEFVGRFGKLPSLDNYGRQLSIFTYHLIDIALFLAAISFIFMYIFYKVFRLTVRKCCGSKGAKTKND